MTRYNRMAALRLLAVAALPILTACGDDGAPEEATIERGEEEEREQQETETQRNPASRSASSPLTALSGSGVYGSVEFSREDDLLVVAVRATNVEEPGEYPAAVHQGSCDDPGGEVAPLESPTIGREGREEGIAESDTQLESDQLVAGEAYVVLLHGPDGLPIACSTVPQAVLGESTREPVGRER